MKPGAGSEFTGHLLNYPMVMGYRNLVEEFSLLALLSEKSLHLYSNIICLYDGNIR